MSGLFDFNDLGDLPASLAAKLASGGAVNPNIAVYADIVKAGSAAGVKVMSGRMIEAVAFRMGLPTISDNAMRTALNGAVTLKLIKKVSRQTYGVIYPEGDPVDARDAPETDVEVANPPVDETQPEGMPVDPLA